MKNGLVLVGEPMGLLIAQTEGYLNNVSSYDLAVAGAEFNVAIGYFMVRSNVWLVQMV